MANGKRRRNPGVRARMADGREGARMRRIKGALHAHETIRSEGRIPGDEGRRQAMLNRLLRIGLGLGGEYHADVMDRSNTLPIE